MILKALQSQIRLHLSLSNLFDFFRPTRITTSSPIITNRFPFYPLNIPYLSFCTSTVPIQQYQITYTITVHGRVVFYQSKITIHNVHNTHKTH